MLFVSSSSVRLHPYYYRHHYQIQRQQQQQRQQGLRHFSNIYVAVSCCVVFASSVLIESLFVPSLSTRLFSTCGSRDTVFYRNKLRYTPTFTTTTTTTTRYGRYPWLFDHHYRHHYHPTRTINSSPIMMTTRSKSTATTTTTTSNDTNDSSVNEFQNPGDTTIRTILQQTRTIIMIGASTRPDRDSFHVMEYLMNQCHYTVIPVNPMYPNQYVHDQMIYSSLSDVFQKYDYNTIDMIDIFRRSTEVAPIVQELIQYQKEYNNNNNNDNSTATTTNMNKKTIWMQINVMDPISAQLAIENNFHVVMNKCPLREIPRLHIPLPIVT